VPLDLPVRFYHARALSLSLRLGPPYHGRCDGACAGFECVEDDSDHDGPAAPGALQGIVATATEVQLRVVLSKVQDSDDRYYSSQLWFRATGI
jgi:hypothetical protein